jgi:hypothetical protein
MNAAELLDKVADIYKKSFWKQMAFAAIIYLIGMGALFAAFMILSFVSVVFAMISYAGGDFYDSILIITVLAMLPLIMIWTSFSSSGHILLSRQAFYGFKVKLFGMGIFKVFFRVFSALLAQAIVIIPFFIVAAVLFVAFMNVVPSFVASSVEIVKYGGFIIFAVVMLIIGIAYAAYSHMISLSVAVAAFERQYFFGTIKRSWELLKTDFWRTFGIRMIAIFVIFAFSMSIRGIISMFIVLWGLFADTMPMAVNISALLVIWIISFVGPMLASLITAPLDGILHALIYFNQRIKNEGLDIEIKIDELAARQ